MNKKETLKQWILKQRLENYGYDAPWFRKMTSKKVQLKKQIEVMRDEDIRKNLAKAGILGGSGGRLSRSPTYKVVYKNGKRKLVRSGKKEWEYTTGQSFNEELLNIMQVTASGGKKTFWEVQDKWWD